MHCSPLHNGIGVPHDAVFRRFGGDGLAAMPPVESKRTEGSPPWGAEARAANLYSVGPTWDRTMKQTCASAARLRGGGPILTNGSTTMSKVGSPPPRIVIGSWARSLDQTRRNSAFALRDSCVDQAGWRSTTPCGTSPVWTMRHSAMISLRARATIIFVLRAPLGPSVLLRNHLASALSF